MKHLIIGMSLLLITTLLCAQNNVEINLQCCKIKKKQYLPVLVEIKNKSEKDVYLQIPSSLPGFLVETTSYRNEGWHVYLKSDNGKLKQKGFDRIKPLWIPKKTKVKTKFGTYIHVEGGRGKPTKPILIEKEKSYKYKLLITLSKCLYRGMKRGQNYYAIISYDSNEAKEDLRLDIHWITEDIYLKDSVEFKKRGILFL